MTDIDRREMLALLGATAALAACGKLGTRDATGDGTGSTSSALNGAGAASHFDDPSVAQGPPQFFTPHEFATVTMLADLIIPRDERSGSASDAGAPAYIDYALREVESERTRVAIRGGLAWLDHESRRRYGTAFVDAAPAQRTGLLDCIAWPAKTKQELRYGAVFFSAFRDLVATAFWSSTMGVEDLRYMGNAHVAEWNGCPPEALAKLGVRYDDTPAST
ncbi:MAG TPA: gluconate 2-dehydrogenase subunit 3 family protein [Gemmatimonadaceae bacterium]|nr:gluconate 2-dehydrogenase subunit 3 family protein [Gemmatimonadaceae bacterium]